MIAVGYNYFIIILSKTNGGVASSFRYATAYLQQKWIFFAPDHTLFLYTYMCPASPCTY